MHWKGPSFGNDPTIYIESFLIFSTMDTINIVQQNGVGKGRLSGSDYSTFDEKTCNTEQE